MKRFLPILFLIVFLFSSGSVYAQVPTPTTAPGLGGGVATIPTTPPSTTTPNTADPQPVRIVGDERPIPGCVGNANSPWICDNEVTFIGKASSRAKDFLNWTMAHYRWVEYTGENPMGVFWTRIRNIMYILLILFVLATAFILMITRGRSVTVMRFIPRFVFVLIFATLSFAIVSFLYQITDVVQGFFLQGPGLKNINPDLKVISGDNLFFISWDYQTFLGYRSTNPLDQESAFMSILLLKMTAITFYVMGGLLLVRKVILWLFIAVSPVFPFLLLYYPIRNTGKIWIGEFFRWLLYGPLFAIFIYGLVALWQFSAPNAPLNATGIPLNFDTSKAGSEIKYPTAINIVIGGPGQTINRDNNVNLPDTFVLYVFALIMVWVVTFFPFVLLRIFLDHMHNMLGGDNWFGKQLNKTPFGNAPKPPPVMPFVSSGTAFSPPPPPPIGAPTGMAKQMPSGVAMRLNSQDLQVNQQILKTANLSVPTMRDIARMDTASISSGVQGKIELSQMSQSLQKIANPTTTTNSMERSQYTMVREKLMQESEKGNLLAKSILSAANTVNVSAMPQQQVASVIQKIANPVMVILPAEKEKYEKIHEKVVEAGQKGNSLAQSVLESRASASELEQASKSGDPVAQVVLDAIAQQSSQHTKLPTINRVQAVSLDDYESVKKMWKENYQKLEPPQGVDRMEWVSKDQQKISETINLLNSSDPEIEKRGMQMVGNVLPFLLIGGFSKTEVVAYLKAKQEAGKNVLEEVKAKEEEEESKVAVSETKKTDVNRMTMEQAVPQDTPKEEPKEVV